MNKLILASASPRRADLLRSLKVDFEVTPGSTEEVHDESLPVAALCELNARRKAADILKTRPGRLVLAADTLVTLSGKLYGKPADLDEARRMLRELGGQTHEVITGVCLSDGARESVFSEVTRVQFKELTSATIEQYISNVSVLDKAGAYGIQERGEMLVESVDGSFTNVVGLPLERLARELDAWGISYSSRSR